MPFFTVADTCLALFSLKLATRCEYKAVLTFTMRFKYYIINAFETFKARFKYSQRV